MFVVITEKNTENLENVDKILMLQDVESPA